MQETNHPGAGGRFPERKQVIVCGGRRKRAETRGWLRLWRGHVTRGLITGVPALQESPEHAGVPVDGGGLRVGHQELSLRRPQH